MRVFFYFIPNPIRSERLIEEHLTQAKSKHAWKSRKKGLRLLQYVNQSLNTISTLFDLKRQRQAKTSTSNDLQHINLSKSCLIHNTLSKINDERIRYNQWRNQGESKRNFGPSLAKSLRTFHPKLQMFNYV